MPPAKRPSTKRPSTKRPSTKRPSTKTPSTKTPPKKTPSTNTSRARADGAVASPGVDSLLNLAVLRGPCSGPAEIRILESGTRLGGFAVRCPTGAVGDERATSVPVTVWDPPAWIETLTAGDEVVVVGRIRRRFYQRAGGVGSRVDVEAELVGRAHDRRRIDAALRRAHEALEALA